MKHEENESLLIKNGDKAAFDRFFMQYYSQTLRFVHFIVKDNEAAEDITQNTFLKLWLGRSAIDPDKPIKSLLFTMAKNKAMDHLRKIAREPEREPAGECAIPFSGYASDRAEARDLKAIIEDAVKDLPEKRKAVFLMRREDELTNDEVSRRLGLSVRTVEKHMELAMKDIRKKLS